MRIMTASNGGPITPQPAHGNTFFSGISVREYFIAHAPAVPEWFKPEIVSEPTHPSYPPDLDSIEAGELSGWPDYIDTKDLEQPRVREYAAAVDTWRKQRSAWRAEYIKERTLQWPAYWADEMIARSGS